MFDSYPVTCDSNIVNGGLFITAYSDSACTAQVVTGLGYSKICSATVSPVQDYTAYYISGCSSTSPYTGYSGTIDANQ
jgi:hypothetical protein